MSFVIFGRPVGWKGTFVSTGARKKKWRKIICLLPTQTCIHYSLLFPFGRVVFISPCKWLCQERFQIAIAWGSPSLSSLWRSPTSPWHHLQAVVLSLQACEQAALGTQFAHSECSGILFIAGSFFWIAHFSGMAIIAFTDISGDVDYFAFVSHLYGKGLQVPSVLWPLTQLERCQGHVHQKVKAWGQCDIASVLGVLDIHVGLQWGWNNAGKIIGLKKNFPCYHFKAGKGVKGKYSCLKAGSE